MIEDTISNLNFIKESIGKFKNEIQKFISDPSYANHNVINLRQSIDDLEKKIIQKEKTVAVQILHNNSSSIINNQSMAAQVTKIGEGPYVSNFANMPSIPNLPQIVSSDYKALKYIKRNEDFSDSRSNFRKKAGSAKFDGNYQKEDYKQQLVGRRGQDPFHDLFNEQKRYFKFKRETNKLIEKYGINDDERNNFKIKRTVGVANYMDKSKIMKYSSHNKNYYTGVLYDQNRKPIITKDEVDKGMLNMIYRGLIPKNADLTPAFEKDGNPVNLTNKIREIYTKSKLKDVIETDSSTYKKLLKLKEETLFLTAPKKETVSLTKTSKSDYITKEIKEEIVNDPSTIANNHMNTNKSILKTTELEQEEELFKDYIQAQKVTLIFSNFKITINEEYIQFKSKNEERWGVLIYLIEHLQKLFKKLNFTFVEVDGYKLEKLALDELRNFSIKDFLNCISDKDLNTKGLNIMNERALSSNIRDIFIIKIQNLIRIFLARCRAKNLKSIISKVSKIQRFFRMHKYIHESREYLNMVFNENFNKWKELIQNFKRNWKHIKNGPRVEIHINSWSFSNYKNCTIEKFQEKESSQLSRLIALADPNVEIIYISPFNLSSEVLSYYFSILQTLGVENAKDRFLLIVPDIKDTLPPHFSLSQLLLFSLKSIRMIKEFIRGKEDFTFIIPGKISIHDLKLSMYIEIPIMIDDFEMTQTLFTKSGSKRVFELMSLALPISAWDIKTEDEFYTSLTQLIKNYLSINIWIFKIDCENGGRGIAYINLDKIKSFVELKKDRLNNVLVDDVKFENSLIDILRKAVPKKTEFATSKLYRSWDEFFIEFCENKGVIESCPTSSLSGIIGCPALTFLIEPDGSVEQICTYDRHNVNNFRNFLVTSPQRTIPNLNSHLIIEKLGKYLYEQGVIGYVTTEFIAFIDNQKILFWAIDLKLGLTDEISNILFCEFLFNHSSKQNPNTSIVHSESVLNSSEHFIFSSPFIVHPNIANLKMKDLVNDFRSELLIFDIQKKNGIVFNLPDVLQSGILGISGISHGERELWKFIENSFNLLKNRIIHKEFSKVHDDFRNDRLDFSEIISRLRMILKNMNK